MSEFERGYNMGVEDGHRCERRHAQLDQLGQGVQQLREQNRVLVKALDDIRKKSYEPDSERPDRLSTRAQIQLMAEAALTATSQEGQHGSRT